MTRNNSETCREDEFTIFEFKLPKVAEDLIPEDIVILSKDKNPTDKVPHIFGKVEKRKLPKGRKDQDPKTVKVRVLLQNNNKLFEKHLTRNSQICITKV